MINAKFYRLEPKKQEQIINVAIEEFAQNGYEKASTNAIVKRAQISKGSLFNYFHNKKDLYLFLLQYVIDLIEKKFAEIDLNEQDLFARVRDVGRMKFQIYHKYPQAFFFLKSIANENAAEVRSEIERIGTEFIDRSMAKMYENIDLTMFRGDFDVQKMIDIINWTALGFAEQKRNQVSTAENIDAALLTEWDAYADLLKRLFYK